MRIKREEEQRKDGVWDEERENTSIRHFYKPSRMNKGTWGKRWATKEPSLHVSSKMSSLGLGPKSKYQGLHNAEGPRVTFLWF